MRSLRRPSNRIGALLLVLALLVFAGTGCGDDSEDETSAAETAAGAQAGGESASSGLAEPLLARCGVERFGKPSVEPQVYDGARGWQVVYQVALRPGEQRDPALASIITVIERTPEGERGDLEGGEEAVIAGRPVSLNRASGGETSHAVQWKTASARYVALVGGRTLESLEEIVRCMP